MNENVLNIGVVGYCPPTQFDAVEARRMIEDAYSQIETLFPEKSKTVVSGLTNVGVLAIAYAAAVERGWKTVGIACKRAEEHELFPVDEKKIVGENWGDESEAFLASIDVIVRIGTGPQSMREAQRCRDDGKLALEYDLPTTM